MILFKDNKRSSQIHLLQIEEVLNDTTINITEEDREKLNSMKTCCMAELGISFADWQLLDKYLKLIHPPVPQEPRLNEFARQWSDSVLKTARGIYWVVMIAAVIFKDRWAIWIIATIVYICYVTHHKKNLRK